MSGSVLQSVSPSVPAVCMTTYAVQRSCALGCQKPHRLQPIRTFYNGIKLYNA